MSNHLFIKNVSQLFEAFGKIFLYVIITVYLVFVLIAILVFNIILGLKKLSFFCIKALIEFILIVRKEFKLIRIFIVKVFKKGIIKNFKVAGLFTIKIVKRVPMPVNILKKLFNIFSKVLLILIIPPLFIFLLIIILLSKIFPYLYKWIAYGITALRAIITIISESRSANYEDLDNAIEFTGFLYEPDQDIFYSAMNPWQRKFGYCRMYDEAAALWGMVVDCEPVYFEYRGRKWLIEFWKGQYDLTTGCEIGIYTTEGPVIDLPGIFNGTFYNSESDEDLLYMSFILKKNDDLLIKREDKHWWLTGFKLGEFSKPSELSMEINITLKDKLMRIAFVKGLKKAGYMEKDITQIGNSVSFVFSKPKTSQPFTRTKLTDWLIQKKNKYMCTKYQDLTGSYNDINSKLMAIQQRAPRLYKRIINIGRSIKLYSKYSKINSYIK